MDKLIKPNLTDGNWEFKESKIPLTSRVNIDETVSQISYTCFSSDSEEVQQSIEQEKEILKVISIVPELIDVLIEARNKIWYDIFNDYMNRMEPYTRESRAITMANEEVENIDKILKKAGVKFE